MRIFLFNQMCAKKRMQGGCGGGERESCCGRKGGSGWFGGLEVYAQFLSDSKKN